MIVFDIETGSLPEEKIIDQFDPEAVKLGNLKDPDKIETKKEEAREKFLRDAALSPLTGQVLAIGFWDGENDIERIFAQNSMHQPYVDEAELLQMFWNVWKTTPTQSIVGFNIIGFDLPFLVRRSFLLGISIPEGVRQGRYFSNQFVDLLEIWRCGDRMHFASLDAIDRALGNPGKPDDVGGADFDRLFHGTPEQREQALDYLTNDVAMTRRVAEALQVL